MKPEQTQIKSGTLSRPGISPHFHGSPNAFSASTFDRQFAVDCKDYEILLAGQSDALRTRISLLIEKLYACRGLHATHAELTPHPRQTTLVACRDKHHLFGTVTLGLDSSEGLMADTLYREQIDAVRLGGGRVCEVTRLAVDPEFGSSRVMAQLFHLVFIIARLVHGKTDLFAEVHPRHSAYYRRMLGYRLAGPEKVCPRVGAPAVLLHISLHDVEHHIRQRGASRNLYRHFFSLEEQWRLFDQLRGPLGGPAQC